MRSTSCLFTVGLAALAALLAGCGKGKQEATPAGSASAAPSGSASPAGSANLYGVPVGIPLGDKVVAVVNPKHQQPYAGPKGTLRGTVRIDGDPPPDSGLKFPKRCQDSEATYGKIFRVGLDKALADAMVAVTGYGDRGYVPPDGEVFKLTIHRCVPSKRTYAVTFGQRVEVSNLDPGTESYIPYLDGANSHTVLVAIPQGPPIKLYPQGPPPKHYMLRDQMDSGMVADVYLVAYATHDVTGLDGKYEIKDIPVGEVRVDAFLPVVEKTEAKTVQIKEGDNTLDFTLHFDAAKDLPKPAGSASAGPKMAPIGDEKHQKFR
jgi:hypothetical protein